MAKSAKGPTIRALVERWNDESVASALVADFRKFLKKGQLAHTVDLRGAQFVSGDRRFDFTLIDGEFRDVDLSHAKGALFIHSAKLEKLIAKKFAFDRASSFIQCQISDADFDGSRGQFDALDAEFKNCTFRNTVFKGGFQERGFQRCVFRNCCFEGIHWKNTYLRAVYFYDCDFTNSIVETSALVGVRFVGFSDWRNITKNCSTEGIYVDGVRQ